MFLHELLTTLPGVTVTERSGTNVFPDGLDSRIRETVVDLKYRGDYTDETRKLIQTHIVKNDFDKFKDAMTDKSKWTDVPVDRFDRRKKFLMTTEKKL